MSDNRNIAYLEDEFVIIRASALGSCPRALWAALEGIEPVAPPDWLTDAAERGDKYEIAMRRQLPARGFEVLSEQDEVEMPIEGTPIILRGHTDGRIFDAVEEWGWECKSMSETVFAKWMNGSIFDFPRYAWQLSFYMAATKLPFIYQAVRAHPDAASMSQQDIDLHVQRSDTAISTDVFTEPPFSRDVLIERALKIYAAYSIGEMPECEVSYPCSYFFLHDEMDDGDPAPLAEQWADLAAEYHEVRGRLASLEARKKELREVLVAAVGENAEIQAGPFKVKVSERTGRVTLDTDRLKADHPEIEWKQYETRGKSTTVLNVTRGES